MGRVNFAENVPLTAASVAGMQSHHWCSDEAFKELRSKWKKTGKHHGLESEQRARVPTASSATAQQQEGGAVDGGGR